MKNYIDFKSDPRFVSLIDGDCINEYDGTVKDGILYVDVKVASKYDTTINGVVAPSKNGYCVATLPFNFGKTKVVAKNQNGECEMTLVRLSHSVGGFRLSSDDNIIFLKDITDNKDVYTSIFDNPYLAVYKKAHDLYGANAHINLFYKIEDNHPNFSINRGYFDLSMVTDKFRDEWIANSDWLKLNFHSDQEYPPEPYKNADYKTVLDDCIKVQNEIIRFAGKETLSEETTVHFGECSPDGIKALRERGIKALAGYFMLRGSKSFVSYFYPKYMAEHICNRDFWYDSDLDMLYGKIEYVINMGFTPKEIVELLNITYENKSRGGFMEAMIHEQFFYEDYVNYLPDFEQRILESCRFAKEKGFKPAFLIDVL